MGLIISLTVITSAILLSQERRTVIDKADGVEVSTPDANIQLDDTNKMIESIIIRSNRNGMSESGIISKIEGSGNTIEAQSNKLNNFNRHTIEISNVDSVEGERYYNDNRDDVVDGEVIDISDTSFSGSITLNIQNKSSSGITQTTTSNAATSNTLEIKSVYSSTGNNTLYIYHPQNMAYDIAVVSEQHPTDPIAANGSYVNIDVATGRLNGYNIPGYTTPEDEIYVNNTNTDMEMTQEYVLNSPTADSSSHLTNQNAVYAIIYDITMKTNRKELKREMVATHGPTTND
jgi:hypothetical protein